MNWPSGILIGSNVILVVVTGFYAWTTHKTLEHFKASRKVEEAAARHALCFELLHIRRAIDRRSPALLPTSVWAQNKDRLTSLSPTDMSELADLYAKIEACNAGFAMFFICTVPDHTQPMRRSHALRAWQEDLVDIVRPLIVTSARLTPGCAVDEHEIRRLEAELRRDFNLPAPAPSA